MSDIVTYMVDGGDGVFKCTTSLDAEDDPEMVAEDCAQNYHDQHDGWEAHWPVEITLLREDGSEIVTCEVDREAIPSFTATKKARKV